MGVVTAPQNDSAGQYVATPGPSGYLQGVGGSQCRAAGAGGEAAGPTTDKGHAKGPRDLGAGRWTAAKRLASAAAVPSGQEAAGRQQHRRHVCSGGADRCASWV